MMRKLILVLFFLMPGLLQAQTPEVSLFSRFGLLSALNRANEVEMDISRMALSQSGDEAITNFAQQMITDFMEANIQVADLAGDIDLEMINNNTIDDLEADEEQARAYLTVLIAGSFDQAFLEQIIHLQRQYLSLLDLLDRQTSDPRLANLLSDTRERVTRHLDEAQRLSGRREMQSAPSRQGLPPK